MQNKLAIWEAIATIVSAVVAIISLIQAHSANRKSDAAQKTADELQTELNRVKEYFDACEQYGRIKERIRDCEKAMSKLLVFFKSKVRDTDDKQLAFYEACTSYQSLFNELNSFSALINNGIIKADRYMENTAIPVLKKYAAYQVQMFKILNRYSEILKLGKLSQPDYSAFKEYDKFLREYMTEREYEKVKEKRRNAGLRI